MSGNGDLVSVIIPAFNAEATIGETLLSVRSQTHKNLEIVVVDDGSSDATCRIVEAHASRDKRIRLLEQPQSGPSAARNRAIAATTGPFIAPIDADDLWAPDKIAKQLAVLRAAGNSVGLVYCWYAIIDADSRIRFLDSRSRAEGNVLQAIASRNIVGNGSTPMMTRRAVEAAGGYDEKLYGSEDLKLYFEIAERFEFALIREFLTGYRDLPRSLSSNFERMLDAHDIVEAELAARHTELRGRFARSRTRLLRYMAARSVRDRHIGQACGFLAIMMREDPLGTASNVIELLASRINGLLSWGSEEAALLGRRFPIGDL